MGYIYKITNKINGKVYIGKTLRNNPYKRWNAHINESSYDRSRHRPLYRAMNKYGTDAFAFSIVEKVDDDIINSKECFYIQRYGSYGSSGYNATLGGDGVSYLEYNDKEIINTYKKHKTVMRTSEKLDICNEIISDVLNRNGINPREEAAKLLMNKNKYRATLEDGQTIDFNSVRDAGRYVIDTMRSNGTLESTTRNIPRAAKGIRSTAYGIKWAEL